MAKKTDPTPAELTPAETGPFAAHAASVAAETAPAETAPALVVVSFDDVDAAISATDASLTEESADDSEETAAPVTEETVLASIATVESAFANHPLKTEIFAIVKAAQDLVDPVEVTPLWVNLGVMCADFMVKKFKLSAGSYSRAGAVKECAHALRLGGIKESVIRVNDILAYHWLIKLDRSTPGVEGEPRTFASDPTPPEWFGGHLKPSFLRVLRTAIEPVSKSDELDVYEFKSAALEGSVRDWIKRLRATTISTTQVEGLLAWRLKCIAADEKSAAYAGLTDDERESVEDGIRAEDREKRLQKLGTKLIAVKKDAAALGYGKAELAKLMADKSVISAVKYPTPETIAAKMTKGDAKALIQEMVRLYASNPDRLDVLKYLAKAETAVRQINALNLKLAAASQAS